MKKLWKTLDFSLVAFLFAVIFCTFTFYYNRSLAIAGYVFSVVFIGLKFYFHKTKRERLGLKIKKVSDELDFQQGKAFEKLTVPCAVVENDGSIVWLNSSFMRMFEIDKESTVGNLKQIIKRDKLDLIFLGCGHSLRVDNKYFSVYSNEIVLDEEVVYFLYFFDETKLRITEKEYHASRPSILHTVIDNADEIYQSYKESDCTSIFSRAEQIIDDWASSFGALCRKFSNARMMIFAEERALEKMIEDKFTILDKIRDLTYEGKETDITLSIGVGKSDSLTEANEWARQALDMAQSRGGDQVAIKKDSEYKFYGGLSAGFEKKNTVRTRFVAKSISEIIRESDNVLIMGHRHSDFDSFGACAGMLSIAQHFSKTAHIVTNEKSTLAAPLIEKFKQSKSDWALLSPSQALEAVTENTLLIVCDTHKQTVTECPELVDKVKKVMVIDHHRKSVGFIEDAVLFYHMSNTSSASEMVAEIAQYVDTVPVLDKFAATALMAGIMLDTRNFILRAGVRTFQAAAYLRQKGANTIDCKKLFSNDMELFRHRNSIIDMAYVYSGCAISKEQDEYPSSRLVTSQAADEMLNIEGVSASFVLYKVGHNVSISARSYGEINVQLIMENLGGGGHQTMSACQLTDISVDEAEAILKETIDKYFENINGGKS